MENMDNGLTVPINGADKSVENAPKLMPKLSEQAQKFGISLKKKASLGVRSPSYQP